MEDRKNIATHKAPEGSDLYSKFSKDTEIEVQAERMYDGSTLYTAWVETPANIYEHQYTDVNRLNGYLHSQGFYGVSPVRF